MNVNPPGLESQVFAVGWQNNLSSPVGLYKAGKATIDFLARGPPSESVSVCRITNHSKIWWLEITIIYLLTVLKFDWVVFRFWPASGETGGLGWLHSPVWGLGWRCLVSGPQGLPWQPHQGFLARWPPQESQWKYVTPVTQQAWNLHVTSTN